MILCLYISNVNVKYNRRKYDGIVEALHADDIIKIIWYATLRRGISIMYVTRELVLHILAGPQF